MITYSIYTRPIIGLCYDFLDLYEVHVLSLLNHSYVFLKKQFSMFSKNNVCEINLFQPFIYRTLKKKYPWGHEKILSSLITITPKKIEIMFHKKRNCQSHFA